jgi:uncharacterized membrane protein YvbJ
MDMLIIIIVIAIIILFILLSGKLKRSEATYEKLLLSKCFGDANKVERLINYELKRNPRLTREEAARNASNSITRDNR